MLYGNLYATRGSADQIEKDKEFEQGFSKHSNGTQDTTGVTHVRLIRR